MDTDDSKPSIVWFTTARLFGNGIPVLKPMLANTPKNQLARSIFVESSTHVVIVIITESVTKFEPSLTVR